MPSLMPTGKQQYFYPGSTSPLVGGQLYTYAAGTSNLKATYQDAAGQTANTNPITLDSTGSALVFWSGSYKVVLKDAAGNTVYTVDNYNTDQSAALQAQLATSAGASLTGFIQAGTGAVARTEQDELRDSVKVKQFGAKADGVTNDLAACNACLAAYDTVRFTPGVYVLNGDLVLKSNQYMIVEEGAKLIVNGGRITSYLQNNIRLRVDGEISSVGMTAAPARAGWPDDVDPGNAANVTHERGFIEFGGTSSAIANGFQVFGKGVIHGDWTGTPSTAGLWTGNLNFKGIAAWYANNVMVRDVEVYGFKAEAVYYYTSTATKNVLFDALFAHDNNFNALNFNCTAAVTNAVMRNCVVDGAWQGIEISVGRATGCTVRNCESYPVQFGGGVVLDVQVDRSYIYGKANQGVNLINAAGNPASVTGVVNLLDNYLSGAAQTAIYATALTLLRVAGNVINGYAQNVTASTQGFGIDITSSVGTAITDQNIITSPSANFGTSIRNLATVALNSNVDSQNIASNKLLKLQQVSPPSTTQDEHEYYVFNGLGSAPRRFTSHYANGVPENLAGSDEFLRLHAEATPGTGGTNGRFVIATYKNVPGATPDDSLVVDSTGATLPAYHNKYDLGSNSNMFANLYCVAGVVNRSDARLKTAVAPMSNNEIAAATQLSREIGTYQWLDAVQAKGSAARHHVGMTVQRCIEIMQQNNLDPFAYAFICYDEWQAGPGREAGSAYGFRTDQLALFIQRGIDARLTKAGF